MTTMSVHERRAWRAGFLRGAKDWQAGADYSPGKSGLYSQGYADGWTGTAEDEFWPEFYAALAREDSQT